MMTDDVHRIDLKDVPLNALCTVEGKILHSSLWKISTDSLRGSYNKATGERLEKNGCFVKLYDSHVLPDFHMRHYSPDEIAGCRVNSTLFEQYINQQISQEDSLQTRFEPCCKNTISFFDKDLIPVMLATGDTYRADVHLQCPLIYDLDIRVIVQCHADDNGDRYVKPIRIDLDRLEYQKIWD